MKKLTYKQINNYEFEVYADDHRIGSIKGNIYGKWKIKPDFKLYKQDIKAYKILTKKYNGVYEAGKNLFELWNNTEEEFFRVYFDPDHIKKKEDEVDFCLPDDLFKL